MAGRQISRASCPVLAMYSDAFHVCWPGRGASRPRYDDVQLAFFKHDIMKSGCDSFRLRLTRQREIHERFWAAEEKEGRVTYKRGEETEKGEGEEGLSSLSTRL